MNCLGIFAKHPQIGQVKTRLGRKTSPEWAAAVARAFLHDTVERLAHVAGHRFLVFSPPSARESFARVAGDCFMLHPQAEGDLGRRLRHFIAEQQAAGAQRTVIVGTDSPTLPVEWVVQAFEMLHDADVVLGPATDGGYYLLGCGARLPPIFDDIAWGRPQVLTQTVERLSAPGWRLALLPPWYDVDTGADCTMLAGHIQAMRHAGQDPGVPHTERLLRECRLGVTCAR